MRFHRTSGMLMLLLRVVESGLQVPCLACPSAAPKKLMLLCRVRNCATLCSSCIGRFAVRYPLDGAKFARVCTLADESPQHSSEILITLIPSVSLIIPSEVPLADCPCTLQSLSSWVFHAFLHQEFTSQQSIIERSTCLLQGIYASCD